MLAAAALLAGAGLLAGCSKAAEKPAARTSSPFADCAAVTSAPSPATGSSATGSSGAGSSGASAGPAGASGASTTGPAGAPGAGKPLPDLVLPCFTGDQKVDIGRIKGPALINLWASWCAPCREELPVFQRLAGRAAGRLHVVGVVSEDDRDAARSLAEELGVSFPALYDRQGALLPQVGGAGLPLTVFVSAAGRISYVYNSASLDDASLARLVSQHLGLAVPA